MSNQISSEATALVRRSDRDILDQQMVGPDNGFYQCDQLSFDLQKIEAVIVNGLVVVDGHRPGFAADKGYPFGVSGPRQITYRGGIICRGLAKWHALHGLSYHADRIPAPRALLKRWHTAGIGSRLHWPLRNAWA